MIDAVELLCGFDCHNVFDRTHDTYSRLLATGVSTDVTDLVIAIIIACMASFELCLKSLEAVNDPLGFVVLAGSQV